MSVYEVVLRTLTPIHIGDGDELRQDFDFVVHGGHTYRLDEDAVLQAKQTELKVGAGGHYPPPGKLLSERDFTNPALFRYVLRGSPRSKKVDARIKTFIKDVHDLPYIPGSSLKGALRTALAWTGWDEVNPKLERSAIGRSKSWAAQPLERQLFGRDPNHDLLRVLHVSDLAGPQVPGEGLALVNAQVLTLKSAGSPIELEALTGNRQLTGSLTIDETLFAAWAEGELHFSDRRQWLEELAARAQAHSLRRITELLQWFERADNASSIAGFYRQLAGLQLPPNQALLQLGWGSGWDGKTFWTHLLKEKQLFEQLVSDFRMHKAAPGSPPRKIGDPFPRSKRAVMVVKDGIARPAAPFGWVLIELNRK
jgi:CRISPR-associated protein Csm5